MERFSELAHLPRRPRETLGLSAQPLSHGSRQDPSHDDRVHHNKGVAEPGLSASDNAERSWTIRARFLDRRYPSIIHGVGMHGETPLVAHHMNFDRFSKDGTPEPGIMTSVESDIRGVGAADGVKLEEEVLITDTGIAKLSRYPCSDTLLAG
ncbi:hypothetical protein AAGT95_18145 [Salinicola lusitanus]|uniref:Peptidase M24 domain-containing protein n=1 Tax=Salinicola lusitanus TaxID=1949085 RepID=A0ABZ3CRE4_9GAMM